MKAEVFIVRLSNGVPVVAGPCGPDAWYMDLGPDDDPVEIVSRRSRELLGEPQLVHSTSWRRDRGSVVLTFIVVLSEEQASVVSGHPITRADLARASAAAAPGRIEAGQVLEHGLRHLAWLANDDEVVGDVLTDEWKRVLENYLPEPFRHLR